MIPSTNTKLLIAEDWTKIYQSFNNSDFKSYDFETLRRTMINYLRENYPEDFNDYIDSSEYIALIDLIAYLGQNLSFRVDLNARENFLETAQRRESILRLAQLINYNAKRNVPSSGLLKITSISTTETLIDATGVNLANAAISWNDSTNANWYSQFLTVLNAAMPANSVFGKPFDRKTIDGILSEQYQVSTAITDVPVFSFSKSIGGIDMDFEIVSSSFAEKDFIYEQTPKPGNNLNYIFRNDKKGNSSPNTGFFVMFKQGVLNLNPFRVDTPTENETVGVDITNINDTDVWLWQLDTNGNYSTEWTKVDAVSGNNIIYNSLDVSKRNIFAVTTRADDQIDLNFADGAFGNLPKGNFILFYRQSNGLAYSVKPDQLNGIQVKVPYVNKDGQENTLSLTLSLQYTVNNSATTESNESIKTKAPQVYYTQNRMVTAEDYNIAPLKAGTDILKIKSINRTSSGISKYYELTDVTGKYSPVNIFGTDGALYKDIVTNKFTFSFTNRNEIYAVLQSKVDPILGSNELKHFYFDSFRNPYNFGASTGGSKLEVSNVLWNRLTSTTNQTTGYFKDAILNSPLTTGFFSSTNLKYAINGALLKFIAPSGKYFLPNGKLTTIKDPTTRDYIWTTLSLTIGDGSNNGLGSLSDGTGPITLSGYIPQGAVLEEVIPPLVTNLSYALQSEIINLCLSYRNFGLRFSREGNSWFVINDTDLDLDSSFTLAYEGDTTNTNQDASWIFAFRWTGINYEVTYRTTDYVFESLNQTAFSYDKDKKNYDYTTGKVIKDKIVVLGVNEAPVITTSTYILGNDKEWELSGSIVEADGYIEPKKIKVSFYDAADDGYIDDPDAFDRIVEPLSTSTQTAFYDKFVYFKKLENDQRYVLVDKQIFDPDGISAYPTEEDVPLVAKEEGKYYYFYDNDVNVVMSYSTTTVTEFTLEPNYYAKVGRQTIKFHYSHNSGEDRRLDPSKSNIIDIYMLTGSYDRGYRSWLASGIGEEPLPPTGSSLEENYSAVLEPIKSISDQIIYQSVRYKPLFGTMADRNLQAVFKVVKNPNRSTSDNDIKSRVIAAIEEFFSLDNWDFGQTFYFSELTTYIMNLLTPDITNFIIVPRADIGFGSLYEIACQKNEIFVNGATVDDIEIIDAITAAQIKTTSTIVTSSAGVY